MLARQKLANEPGSRWAYSDAGFNLLGKLVENITGASFAAAVRERLLTPLGMTISGFDLRQQAVVGDQRAIDSRG
jgi:CubicO group peptidase (beta-lactamase class C family)